MTMNKHEPRAPTGDREMRISNQNYTKMKVHSPLPLHEIP